MKWLSNPAGGVLLETWYILNESAPWVLLGFAVAAVVKAFVPDSLITKHLGGNGISSVVKASLFGIPIPLCSCGVIPAAMSLRKQGASKGATLSFLVSTPETGVDSIAITWALLDPIMTVARPVIAFITAMVAGIIENLFGVKDENIEKEKPVIVPTPSCGCNGSCGATVDSLHTKPTVVQPLRDRIRDGFDFTFGELLSDIGKWLLVGILLAGVVAYVIPDDFFEMYVGRGILQHILMLVVGIPIYICATSSTPLAAALVLKGLSPGAALVFLVAGPATNAATMTVVYKFLGKGTLIIYLAAIVICTLGMGLLLDHLYTAMGWSMVPRIGDAHSDAVTWFTVLCSIVLLSVIGRAMWVERSRH